MRMCGRSEAHVCNHTVYLSWAVRDGDAVFTGDVTGAVVGGAGARAWCTVACRVCYTHSAEKKYDNKIVLDANKQLSVD